MAKDQYDQIREAEFREIARRIVSKDRDSKKYRFSVDTAGEILRALEKAYQQGKNEQKLKKSFVMPIKRKDAVYWGCIPPCPRRAFYALCSHLLDYSYFISELMDFFKSLTVLISHLSTCNE